MISTPDRRQTLELIDKAVASGERKARACEALGLSLPTVQRGRRTGSCARTGALRPRGRHRNTP